MFKFRKFVDKHRLWFFLGIMAFFACAMFIPFITRRWYQSTTHYSDNPYSPYNEYQERSIFGYLIQIPIWLSKIATPSLDGIWTNKRILSVVLYFIKAFIASVFILSAIIIPALMLSKKKGVITAFFPLFLFIVLFPFIIDEPRAFGKIPVTGFYFLLILVLFEIINYISIIVCKRFPNYTPKPPKPKKLTDKERIAQLEREIAEIKSDNEKGD
jgi:hypothetical protein